MKKKVNKSGIQVTMNLVDCNAGRRLDFGECFGTGE